MHRLVRTLSTATRASTVASKSVGRVLSATSSWVLSATRTKPTSSILSKRGYHYDKDIYGYRTPRKFTIPD
ncbi:hypothetical protein HDU76_008811, partial [Blyttiomyces sp. JEL0837]